MDKELVRECREVIAAYEPLHKDDARLWVVWDQKIAPLLNRIDTALSTLAASGWIPVSERLPTSQYEVWVTDGIHVGRGDYFDKMSIWNLPPHMQDETVLFWKEIWTPAAPKREDKG